MKPLSQRDATVTESPCQVSRNLSQEAAAGWNLTAGVSLWVGETGDLALEVTSHKICLQRKFDKAIKRDIKNNLSLSSKGASRAVLNGRLAEVDLCLRQLNQRAVTVIKSP